MEQVRSDDGTKLDVAESGYGPALLLIHGTTADHSRWEGVLPAFEARFTVFNMDRRGRGRSGDTRPYELQREAEDVAAVVDAIGRPVAALGHSYGAVCTLEASLLTDGMSRMVLYEPPLPTGISMYPAGLPDRMEEVLAEGEPEQALELFFTQVVRMPADELERYRQLPVWQRRIELASTIPRELALDRGYAFDPAKFAGLGLPVTLLLGGDSPELFQSAVEVAHEALVNSEVVLLPGQQHIAMDTDPELFVTTVLDCLTDG